MVFSYRPFLVTLVAAGCLMVFVTRSSADTITVPIAAPFDDMEEQEDGTMDINSSDLELNTEGPPEPRQIVGLRFTNIGIPAGSTINSAAVQFMVDEDDDEVTSVRLFGELVPDSAPFAETPFNLSPRARTTSSVVWSNIPVWTGEGTSGPDQLTPDLSPIIQEIISQPGWAAGNALSIFVYSEPESDNTGERTAVSFENASDPATDLIAPILSVDFTPIPEPSSLVLAIAAVGALAMAVRQAKSLRN